MSDTRSRSASPARDEAKAKKRNLIGFKWKDKTHKEEDRPADDRDSGKLERGYRNRSPRRSSYREREKDRSPRRDDQYRDRDARRETDSYRPRDREQDPDRQQTKPSATSQDAPPAESKPKKEKKPKKPVQTEPMIIVNINDRLGTKAAIPCLASDSVKAFKAVVAAHIGRQPHEIMLKRQGERPFKDQLTLEDYGVSNGVQLDLELDTGD